jgi:hypothetical protein
MTRSDENQKQTICPACGAVHNDETTCQDDFYQMLYWEHELMAEGVELIDVHFLMVASYHMQHPHLYSSEALAGIRQNVAKYLAGELTVDQIREETRESARSDKRKTTVTARAGNHGGYATPVEWTMRAVDVVAAGKEQYPTSVRTWAKSIIAALEGVAVIAH